MNDYDPNDIKWQGGDFDEDREPEQPKAGELSVIQFILHNKNHVVVGYLRLKDGWTQFAERGEWGKELCWVYPCPVKWHHWHCDIIDRLKKESERLYQETLQMADANANQLIENDKLQTELAKLEEQLIKMCRVFHAMDCICKRCNIVKERAAKGVEDMGFTPAEQPDAGEKVKWKNEFVERLRKRYDGSLGNRDLDVVELCNIINRIERFYCDIIDRLQAENTILNNRLSDLAAKGMEDMGFTPAEQPKKKWEPEDTPLRSYEGYK